MKSLKQAAKDYSRIEKAIGFLGEHFDAQPDLAEIAQRAGVSEFHFQRIFQRWAGISPKRFLQFLTKEYAKGLLAHSNLLDVSHEAGLSGPGRLHDLFITCEAMSPGEYKDKGAGLTIEYGFHPTPFGTCFIAVTGRGICALAFIEKKDEGTILRDFQKKWNNAKIKLSPKITKIYVKNIFEPSPTKKVAIKLLCRGTNFQIKVWEALLRIPSGHLVTYQTIAGRTGHPRAVRAVGTAIGNNPIAYLIPCHRVIRASAGMGGYRWGVNRKKAILGKEATSMVYST